MTAEYTRTLVASEQPPVRACQASGEAAGTLPQLSPGEQSSRGAGGHVETSAQGYVLSTENVDEDGPTLVWPPVFFGEVVRVAPYPADQQLPDPRVASAMAATVRQTPARLGRP